MWSAGLTGGRGPGAFTFWLTRYARLPWCNSRARGCTTPGPADPEWVLEHRDNPRRWILYAVRKGELAELFHYRTLWIEPKDLAERINEIIHDRPVADGMIASFQQAHPGIFTLPASDF